MNDPQRLVDELAGDPAGELLRAVRRDAPPANAHERALLALGIGASVAGASTAAASATAISKTAVTGGAVMLAKWAGIGAATAVLAVGGAREIPKYIGARSSRSSVAVTAPAPAPKATAAPPVRAPLSLQEIREAPPPPTEQPSPVGTPERSRGAIESLNPPPKPPSAEEDLAQEVRTLDRARQAIAARDPSGALVLLDAYRKQFARGAMGPEATVLRIEALLETDRKQAARQLAQDFLSAHPGSPHTKRIRGLLEGASN